MTNTPINADIDQVAKTITLHYHKEGWQNFCPGTTSQIKATGVLVEWN